VYVCALRARSQSLVARFCMNATGWSPVSEQQEVLYAFLGVVEAWGEVQQARENAIDLALEKAQEQMARAKLEAPPLTQNQDEI
jgi:hypothetical protein